TAKRLWLLYVGYTAAETILLYYGGMNLFDAVCHSFTTMATGGYSTKQASIAHFNSPFIEYVIIAFMFIAGTNFSLGYFAINFRFRKIFKNQEFKAYFGLILLMTVVVTTGLIVIDNITPELVNEQETEPTQVEETKPEEPVEEEVVKEEPKVHQEKFYIVVGSFKKFSNAQNLSNYFEKEGYKPMILPKVNGYNRVAIMSYVEKANAQKAVKRAREKYNDLTFWIYKW
ncbi:MAG: SPOR domain-containing protein, partial [Bacteroidales bacterium]|nr:SPOR domain-containing protein [Bacteroidales bacterium]